MINCLSCVNLNIVFKLETTDMQAERELKAAQRRAVAGHPMLVEIFTFYHVTTFNFSAV